MMRTSPGATASTELDAATSQVPGWSAGVPVCGSPVSLPVVFDPSADAGGTDWLGGATVLFFLSDSESSEEIPDLFVAFKAKFCCSKPPPPIAVRSRRVHDLPETRPLSVRE